MADDKSSKRANFAHAFRRQERDKYFPAPPVPPSENLDRYQWYNPADWFGMHEEDKYQQEEKKYKRDLEDLSERREPVHGRVYVVPHEATMNREHGAAQHFVYLPPKVLDKKKYPKGAYAPVWWNKSTNTAGKKRYWKDNLIPHTTDDKGTPNTVRVRGGGVKDVIEPLRDVIPSPTSNPTKHLHIYRNLRWKDDYKNQEIRRPPYKDWLQKPVNSGAFNNYMRSMRPTV
jgi:hypothetical protein|tara:strand:- start:127 stop:816 length:690 start_codon:yes stop_codon:yes gene_type:complete